MMTKKLPELIHVTVDTVNDPFLPGKKLPPCLNSEPSFNLRRKPIYYIGLHFPSYNGKRAERLRDSTGPLTNPMPGSHSETY